MTTNAVIVSLKLKNGKKQHKIESANFAAIQIESSIHAEIRTSTDHFKRG